MSYIQVVNEKKERIAPTTRDFLMGIIFDVNIVCDSKAEMFKYYEALQIYRENNLDRIKTELQQLIGNPNESKTTKTK